MVYQKLPFYRVQVPRPQKLEAYLYTTPFLGNVRFYVDRSKIHFYHLKFATNSIISAFQQHQIAFKFDEDEIYGTVTDIEAGLRFIRTAMQATGAEENDIKDILQLVKQAMQSNPCWKVIDNNPSSAKPR